MPVFGIPGWVWINLTLLVAAAIFVGVNIAAAETAGRQKPEPVSADLGRAIR
ncbi:hypothetical protein [Inquilinus sp. CA228]|uniref:hypothetical protein n=1 Tax=Inquilinus sp. CA228 TaxID=3455609 RepID=UPI003F8D0E4E